MIIPSEAVEMAQNVVLSALRGDSMGWVDADMPTDVSLDVRGFDLTQTMRAALEAAAPVLMHRAWVEGYRSGEADCFLGDGVDQPAENKSPYGRKSR